MVSDKSGESDEGVYFRANGESTFCGVCGFYIVLCCIVRQNQCLGTGYCAVFVKLCRIFEI